MEKSFFNTASIDDLQERPKLFAEMIGVDNLMKLSEYFGGTSVYIPKADELFKGHIYKKVLEEFDGGNIKTLAVKYGLSERTIYRIVKARLSEVRYKPMDGQLSLISDDFDRNL